MDLRSKSELDDHIASLAGPLRWHIARARDDATAYQALRLRGYTVYRPLMPENGKMSHGYPSKRRKSMFPGYLPVLPPNHIQRTDAGPWEALRTAPGMFYGDGALLRRNGQFATIPHNDPVHGGVVQIRETEERICNITTNSKPLPGHKIGDWVRVQKGPFIEMLGIIETLDDLQRIGLLIDYGRPTRVYVNSAHIISAEA
jgi:hypothetical protein